MNFHMRQLVLILCLMLSIPTGFAKELVVVGEQWPPFEFIDDKGKVSGIDVEIATEVFKAIGIDYRVEILPWSRAWALFKEGKVDAAFSVSRKEKRIPYTYYPNTDFWVSEYVFFVIRRHKQSSFNGYQDAKNKVVGVIQGNSYNEAFWNAKLNTQVHVDLETNLKLLADDRIDLFPIDKTMGLYNVKLLNLENKLDYYDFVLFSKGYPMVFAKNSTYPNIEKISKDFEVALIAFKQSKKYRDIMHKWLGRRW